MNQTLDLRRMPILSLVAVASLSLAACGTDDDSGAGTGTRLQVVASFYPLQFVVEQVGGTHVAVTNLTPVGGEPHDLELTPRDTATLQDADLVVYLAGFTPAVDEAVASVAGAGAFDVAAAARLDLEGAHEEHEEEEGHEAEEAIDPHFWLDPTRLADVAEAVAAQLGELDPNHADEFTANAASLRNELTDLDGEFETALASCANRNLVTSHTAFGYLAQRYDLTQLGISGLSTEDEPSPARMSEIIEFVQANGVSTIYFETLVDPAIAETIASETGAVTAVLDPLEGLGDQSAGSDYFDVMRANLVNLRAGQDCP